MLYAVCRTPAVHMPSQVEDYLGVPRHKHDAKLIESVFNSHDCYVSAAVQPAVVRCMQARTL